MTTTRYNLAVVGAFVLAAILTLVVALALLAGRTGKTDRYYTDYANVAGLKFGSQVLFEGYPVGQVERIQPVQDGGRTRFRVELSVAQGWQIPVDSVARPASPGVLAAQTVSITAGKSTDLLKPGDRIPPAGGVDLVSSLSSAAGNLDQITDLGILPLLDNLNRQVRMLGEILEKDVRPLMRDLGTVADATATHWPGIVRQIDVASGHLASASARFDHFASAERIATVDRMILNVDRTAESLRVASDQLNTLVVAGSPDLLAGLQDFRYLMTTLARYSQPVGENVDLSVRDLRDFARQLRRDPSVLVRRGEPQPDPVPPLKPQVEP